MRETIAVRNLIGTLLAVALLHGVAHAGVSDRVVCDPGAELRAAPRAVCRANVLYTKPSLFLRGDFASLEDASGRGGAQALRGRAPVFWLPDSMETGWLARDKKLHFLACYSVVLTGDVVTDKLDAGVAWAAGLSVAKELWDLWFKTPASQRGVSRGDLVADAAGVVAAVIAVEAFGD
jgi:hypothetical protein